MSTTTDRAEATRIAWPPLIWIAGLHVGALLAFVPANFTWRALLAGLVAYWLTAGLGICLTYHRLLTHRSFATRPKWLEYALAALACCASEGGPVGWVADHRKHHAHADDDEDIHSPRRGFTWAHMLWWITPDSAIRHTDAYLRRWAPDLYRDPIHRFLDRIHIAFAVLMFAALHAMGGMPWLVWGGFVRSVLVLHSTWLVNSANHLWGYRSFPTRDTSTNLWWVALLTFGEGWHNNHHAVPSSARHGLRWWEFDATFLTIRLLKLVGLVKAVKLPKFTPPAATSPSSQTLAS